MASILMQDKVRRVASDELVEILRQHAQPLPSPDQSEEFGALFDRIGDARVVRLGEATHGTSEFYKARAAITRRLIERHGFTVVAVEWSDQVSIGFRHQHRLNSDAA